MAASESFSDRDSWERRWEQALAQHGDAIVSKPPNPLLVGEFSDVEPGRALDAGCGHGAESIWLAGLGWRVTAVDFSVAALERGRATGTALDLGEQIEWLEGDLGVWTPEPAAYDLVSCLYVHVAGSAVEMVQRLASGVAPGGTLFLVGYPATDPETGEPTMAAGQNQVTVPDALAALTDGWEIEIAENRPREVGGGVDAVVRARRW
ncbi:class I SAM-dependent methyltransferase [Nocardioides marmorisolisilvae]|uniref:Class I SAM-dependent methyltransferase n=1 Tax=Nocardioides marmorisolisilvae TaxID=1542737 RepID=A0A3N0DPZ6_9ACTN|nr:class I SAM-dependent methyltransferase [Nocardioides marmorisolisilvae]RNL77551.1 class I SAM-dependent methyltransferase [Nocardioides marmorisolisilvae]